MPCTCNKKTTTLCPSESIEHKILNEARTFYTWVKTQFAEILGILNTAKPALVYDFSSATVAATGSSYPIGCPVKMISLVVEITGLPTIEDPDAVVQLIAPDGEIVWQFEENGQVELPVSDHYHQDPGALVGWRLKVVGTFAGPVYPTVGYKRLTIAEA